MEKFGIHVEITSFEKDIKTYDFDNFRTCDLDYQVEEYPITMTITLHSDLAYDQSKYQRKMPSKEMCLYDEDLYGDEDDLVDKHVELVLPLDHRHYCQLTSVKIIMTQQIIQRVEFLIDPTIRRIDKDLSIYESMIDDDELTPNELGLLNENKRVYKMYDDEGMMELIRVDPDRTFIDETKGVEQREIKENLSVLGQFCDVLTRHQLHIGGEVYPGGDTDFYVEEKGQSFGPKIMSYQYFPTRGESTSLFIEGIKEVIKMKG